MGTCLQNEALWSEFQKDPGVFEVTRPRQTLLAKHVPDGASVLNLGASGGILEELLLAQGVSVSVLGPDAEALTRLRNRFNLGDRAKVGALEALPFPDAAFDAVLCSEVFEHLEDPALQGVLRECARVLKPGGMLLGTVPAQENLAAAIVFCPHCRKHFHPFGHVRSFTKHTLVQALSTTFTVEKLEQHLLLDTRKLGLMNKIKISLRRLLLRLGRHTACSNFFFIARKRT